MCTHKHTYTHRKEKKPHISTYTCCLSGHHHNFLSTTTWHLEETPATHSGKHKENVTEQGMWEREGKGEEWEPERGGMGNIILKGNEELLKHESWGKGREAQHGSVGGKETGMRETVAKKEWWGWQGLLRSINHYIGRCVNVCVRCTEHNCDFWWIAN